MKIGIFGGSFNPIHKGHISIAKDAINNLNLDKLIFVPAFKSPFKKGEIEDAKHRINMIKIHLEEKMVISKFEINRKGISYTIETLKYFKNKHPLAKIFIIIGSDQLYKLNKWRDIKIISQESQIVVYKRKQPFSRINVKKYHCLLFDNKIYHESSTALRSGEFLNVSREVANYIGKNTLYVKNILSSMLNPKRHKHSFAAARFATKLAKNIKFDIKKTWTAAVFHDITKNWSNKKHRDFLKKHEIKEESIADYKLHSLTGSIWIDKVYCIQDKEITNAIAKHTTLAQELSMLDKIVFAADKLCEGRKYKGIQEDRELIFKNFEVGFKNVVKKTYEHLKVHRPLTPEQDKIYKEWT